MSVVLKASPDFHKTLSAPLLPLFILMTNDEVGGGELQMIEEEMEQEEKTKIGENDNCSRRRGWNARYCRGI